MVWSPFLPYIQFFYLHLYLPFQHYLSKILPRIRQSTSRTHNRFSACASRCPLWSSHCRVDRSCVFIALYLASNSCLAFVKAVSREWPVFQLALVAASVLIYSFQSGVCFLSMLLLWSFKYFTRIAFFLQISELRMRVVVTWHRCPVKKFAVWLECVAIAETNYLRISIKLIFQHLYNTCDFLVCSALGNTWCLTWKVLSV